MLLSSNGRQNAVFIIVLVKCANCTYLILIKSNRIITDQFSLFNVSVPTFS